MKAVILAGGLGARLRPLTEVIPKPLLPIGEKSILEIQIARLKLHGFDEIYLATNYKSEYIEHFFSNGTQYGVRLRVSKEAKPLGTAGPLSLLRRELDIPFIVMNGDILSTIDFKRMYDFALQVGADLTVAVKRIVMPFAFGNIFSEGDFVTGIQEKPEIATDVLAGIYAMRPEILDLIPDDQYFGMDTLIKKMLTSRRRVGKYNLHEFWLDIGQVEDYATAEAAYAAHFKET